MTLKWLKSTALAYDGRRETYLSQWVYWKINMWITVWGSWKYFSGIHAPILWYMYPFFSKEPPFPTGSFSGSRKPANWHLWPRLEVSASVDLYAGSSCHGEELKGSQGIQPELIISSRLSLTLGKSISLPFWNQMKMHTSWSFCHCFDFSWS